MIAGYGRPQNIILNEEQHHISYTAMHVHLFSLYYNTQHTILLHSFSSLWVVYASGNGTMLWPEVSLGWYWMMAVLEQSTLAAVHFLTVAVQCMF
jgi:hypothetical protein